VREGETEGEALKGFVAGAAKSLFAYGEYGEPPLL